MISDPGTSLAQQVRRGAWGGSRGMTASRFRGSDGPDARSGTQLKDLERPLTAGISRCHMPVEHFKEELVEDIQTVLFCLQLSC